MSRGGSGFLQLTQSGTGHSGQAIVSPIGPMIAFWTSRDGNDEVYVMRADGSDVRNLTSHPGRETPVGFSGDGTRVYFRSQRDRPLGDIDSVKLDGTRVEWVTTTAHLPPSAPTPEPAGYADARTRRRTPHRV